MDEITLPQEFRMVPIGSGGTYGFTSAILDPHITDWIGTHGCSTSVGVYHRIDNDRCFMAHIDCYVTGPGKGAPAHEDYVLTRAEGNELKDRIIAQLEKEARINDWVPVLGRKTIACCLFHSNQSTEHRFPTTYIMEAVQLFFKNLMLRPLDLNGFVIDQKIGEIMECGEIEVDPLYETRRPYIFNNDFGDFQPITQARHDTLPWSFKIVREKEVEAGLGPQKVWPREVVTAKPEPPKPVGPYQRAPGFKPAGRGPYSHLYGPTVAKSTYSPKSLVADDVTFRAMMRTPPKRDPAAKLAKIKQDRAERETKKAEEREKERIQNEQMVAEMNKPPRDDRPPPFDPNWWYRMGAYPEQMEQMNRKREERQRARDEQLMKDRGMKDQGT